MNIRGLLILSALSVSFLPACARKKDKQLSKLEKDIVDERIIESERSAPEETPSKEDYSQSI